jgi:UDP:flavonoid glycosyltransferase YjiC (YdhE family)
MENGIIAETIRQAGVEVAEVRTVGCHWDLSEEPHNYSPEDWAAYRIRRNFETWLPPGKITKATQSFLDLTREIQAQAIVSDPFIAAAALTTEALEIPYAIVGAPAISPVEKIWLPAEAKELKKGLNRLDQLCDQFKVTSRHFVQLQSGVWPHSPDLHLSYFSESWYDWRDDIVLPQNKFTGGIKVEPDTPKPDWFVQLPPHQPLILITLGSTFNQEPDFFKTAIKTVSSVGAFPIVATFDSDLTALLSAVLPPELALILDEVDYDHLFPHLTGIIHHGGAGTTHAAILHALPQVIVAPGPGQGTQAYLVSRAGLGKFLHLEEITLESLRSLISEVFTSSAMKANAQRFQAEFTALPGIPGAADWLEEVAI